MAAADIPAAANATNLDQIPDFIHEIFHPAPLTSFRDSMPSGEINILLHRQHGAEPQAIRLINMFPFMTLKDIKLALCLELKRESPVVPEYIYLCIRGETPGRSYSGNRTAPLDFSWNIPGIGVDNTFRIDDPEALASGARPADARFVDSGGDRKLVSPVDRERMTIEDACFKKGVTRGIPVIHAYLYGNLLAVLPGAKPPSEKEWNGRLYPMFPHLSVTSGVQPSPELFAATERQFMVFLRRQQFMVKIESVLESQVPLISLTMAGIKYLQLVWDQKQAIQGIESQFYEAAVTERRPFLRLIPTEGVGLSKVYLSDGKAPDIQDPKLLVQWSQDRSPTPEQDFAFAKIMLRKGLMNVPPIYSTLRLFNDGTADCIVEPPKGVKKMEPRNDLYSLGEQLVEGLQNLPYIKEVPELGKGIFVLGLRARKGADAIITPRILHDRLPIFSAMFQEIAALPGEKPLAMLRFKLVSNFAREDRIQTFLTQVINRKVLRGEGGVGDLINLVAEEFQLDLDEARKQVSLKLRNQGEVTLVVPETKEYMRQNNTGIDVAIFAQHPFYTFHLYNVNSLENLRRIVTALSILISADSETLQVGVKAVRELLTAEADAHSDSQSVAAALEQEVVPVDQAAASVEQAPLPVETEDDEGKFDDFDMFAFGKDEEEIVQEDDYKQEVVAAAKAEGQARPDAPFNTDASLEVAPTTELRREIARGAVQPKDDLAALSPAKAALGPAVAQAAVAQANENAPASTDTGIASFFVKKLQEADSRLFEYTKSNPALKRYVSQCQPTYGRQPAVLSEEKFQELQEEYAADNISFQVYPLQAGEPQTLPGVPEVDYFTVLKYGSSPDRQNYYLCCKYFCTRDEMLILDKDLKSSVMRRPKGAAKLPGQCPFCKGTLMKNRQHPGPNETIIERVIKPHTADRRHLFIGFLKKTPHPEGFYLPCCFTEDVPINFVTNPAFEKYKEWGRQNIRPTTAAAAALLEDDDDGAKQQQQQHTLIDYSTVLDEAAGQYIVGAEKLPLDVADLGPAGEEKAAKYKEELLKSKKSQAEISALWEKYLKSKYETQIGLLPAVLNEYFDQKPTEIVSRTANPQKIQPGGMGFLRVAVENRHRFQHDSFLAAVAPFYGKNNAAQMKEHILGTINARDFLALNYGNLAIEFYDPSDPRPTPEELRRWASSDLAVDVQQENEEAVMRAYMSFTAWEAWLRSETGKKEYRQFALMFAQSPLLRKSYPVGITFIILDILQSGAVSVRCPPYGFNTGLMAKNDVAFILHHWSGIWEPIFFVDHREASVRKDSASLSRTLVFQYSARAVWPPIVHKRLQEFMTQCSSSGRAEYTSQTKMNPLAMIPVTLARSLLESDSNIILDGVIRDAYNHVGALVFREKSGLPSHLIALPVVDDGALMMVRNLYMDWDDPSFTPAPIEVVLRFYITHIKPRFAYYPGFEPQYTIKSQQSDLIEAIQLRNRLYVPVSPPSSQVAEAHFEKQNVRYVKEMEWSKNHEICLEDGGSDLPNDPQRMSVVEFQEIFEHLRLTFSKWIASEKGGKGMRQELERVIFSPRLPLFEKRKRMEILLGREIDAWITTEYDDEDAQKKANTSLLRVDCTVKDRDQCSGRCAWAQSEGEGKCLLHVPKETELGEDPKKVSAPRVLLLRLIEELLRYGERRRQLLEQDVARLTALDKPIVINVPGSPAKQVIYPEKSSAWYELLRLEWAKETDEKPKFLEEMSRERGETALAELNVGSKLPERLETLLHGADGVDPKTGAIRLLRAPIQSLLAPLRLQPRDIGAQPDTVALTDDMLHKIVVQTRGRVVQIDLRSDPPVVSAKKPLRTLYESPAIPVFISTDEGPGLLVLNPSAPELLQKDDIPSGLARLLEQKWGEKGARRTTQPAAAPNTRKEQKWAEKLAAAAAAAAAPPPSPAPVNPTQQKWAEKLAAVSAGVPPSRTLTEQKTVAPPRTLAELRQKLAPVVEESNIPVSVEPEAPPAPEAPLSSEVIAAPPVRPLPTAQRIIPPAPDPFSERPNPAEDSNSGLEFESVNASNTEGTTPESE